MVTSSRSYAFDHQNVCRLPPVCILGVLGVHRAGVFYRACTVCAPMHTCFVLVRCACFMSQVGLYVVDSLPLFTLLVP
jgi:hypothetical protein